MALNKRDPPIAHQTHGGKPWSIMKTSYWHCNAFLVKQDDVSNPSNNIKKLGFYSRNWPHLQSLCIGGEGITLRGLLSIFSQCQELRELELNRVIPITRAVVSLVVIVGIGSWRDCICGTGKSGNSLGV